LLRELNVSVFHFAEPTIKGEPRHPTPRGKPLEITLEKKREYRL